MTNYFEQIASTIALVVHFYVIYIHRKNKWQPIETLPENCLVLCYREVQGTPNIETASLIDGIIGGPGWEYSCNAQPTHWMPIPKS